MAGAYVEDGQLEKATELYEDILSRLNANRLFFGIWDVQARYYLARCYELSGNKTRAIEEYEKFLTIWKEADFTSHLVQEARTNLIRLRQDS